jgi:uncharacterized protein (DUF2062 family)
VLRARFADEEHTTFYVSAATGGIVMKQVTRSRVNRWLYNGLHSLDFPGFHSMRPLWDAVLIALSLGGMLLSATGITIAWRWIRAIVTGERAHRR